MPLLDRSLLVAPTVFALICISGCSVPIGMLPSVSDQLERDANLEVVRAQLGIGVIQEVAAEQEQALAELRDSAATKERVRILEASVRDDRKRVNELPSESDIENRVNELVQQNWASQEEGLQRMFSRELGSRVKKTSELVASLEEKVSELQRQADETQSMWATILTHLEAEVLEQAEDVGKQLEVLQARVAAFKNIESALGTVSAAVGRKQTRASEAIRKKLTDLEQRLAPQDR